MPETEGKYGDFYLRSPYFFIHILPYSSSIHVSQIASASWPSRTADNLYASVGFTSWRQRAVKGFE